MNFVGSRFSGRAHYNEFLESRSKSWALMGRRLVLGVKNALHQTALCPKEKGSLTQECELPTPLASQEHLSFLWAFLFLPLSPFGRSLLLYIPLFRSSSFYTCQSSMPILECTSHRPLFLALCELLWPPSHCLGVTSTSMGSGYQLWVFNMKVTASPGVPFLPCSYDWSIGLGISFGILKGTASGNIAPSSPVILAYRGQGRPSQYILAVWIHFIHLRALLSPRHEPWA